MMYDGTFTSVIARSTSLPRLCSSRVMAHESVTPRALRRTAEQVPIEELDDAALVLLRRGVEGAGVPARSGPVLLPARRRLVVLLGQRLSALAGYRVDEERRLRDLGAQVGEARRGQVAGEDGRSGRYQAEQPGGRDLLDAVHVDRLSHRADSRAFGHDRLEVVRLCGRLEHHLSADGEPDATDAIRVDVRPTPEVGDRRVQIARASPAERVRVTVALTLAAPVEEQNPVALAYQ